MKDLSASLAFNVTNARRDIFVRQRYPSQRIVFVSKARDQPEPGSFFGGGGRQMKEPGNEFVPNSVLQRFTTMAVATRIDSRPNIDERMNSVCGLSRPILQLNERPALDKLQPHPMLLGHDPNADRTKLR